MSVETVVLLHIFFGACDTFFFDSFMITKNKCCVTIYNAIQNYQYCQYFSVFKKNKKILLFRREVLNE